MSATADARPVALRGAMPARSEEPLRGILLIIPAMVFLSASDAMTKYLTADLPALEIGWIRYLTYVAMMIPPLFRPGASLRTRLPGLQVARGLGIVGSSIFFIIGLQTLPMAIAAAMSFCSPIFITILCIPMLGEKVGLRRWGAVVAGIVGVLVVVRPGAAGFQAGVIWPALSSAAWAFAMIFTRRMAGSERVMTTLTWSGCVGLVVLTMLLPLGWVTPSPRVLALSIVMGVLATGGQLLVVMAYRHAPASVLAPFSYTQLLWSSSFGFLVFGAVPDRWTAAGAAIIVASGLYIAHRERIRLREARGS
jgi:drug/metabolite transporter (DMT)-like permease